MHKITPAVDYNYWFERLNTQLNKLTKQNSIKFPKVVKTTYKKKGIIRIWGLM